MLWTIKLRSLNRNWHGNIDYFGVHHALTVKKTNSELTKR